MLVNENDLREQIQQITADEFHVINEQLLALNMTVEKQREHTHKNDATLGIVTRQTKQMQST